eukprot:3270144-Pyramimonas_sp.AAC.1
MRTETPGAPGTREKREDTPTPCRRARWRIGHAHSTSTHAGPQEDFGIVIPQERGLRFQGLQGQRKDVRTRPIRAEGHGGGCFMPTA